MVFLESIRQCEYLIGVDEVGRGPLAGPVVSCAMAYKGSLDDLNEDLEYAQEFGITDSKKLSHKKRSEILNQIGLEELVANKKLRAKLFKGNATFYIKECSEKRIDEINILQATFESMALSVCAHRKLEDALILIDGNKIPPQLEDYNCEAIVKGDSKSFCIGLASIVAKEYRDRLMAEYSKKYPHYGFEKNSGYPTKNHKDALLKYGATKIHRKTFKGVKETLRSL